MKRVDNHFNEVGTFESYVGEIIIYDNNIILPMYNCQLINHPLNKLTGKIVHLDYCYFVFFDVIRSSRDVYLDNGISYSQINIEKENMQYISVCEFLIETIDSNGLYQYWNWMIKAKKFALIVNDNFKIQVNPFNRENINYDFFRTIKYKPLFEIIKLS